MENSDETWYNLEDAATKSLLHPLTIWMPASTAGQITSMFGTAAVQSRWKQSQGGKIADEG